MKLRKWLCLPLIALLACGLLGACAQRDVDDAPVSTEAPAAQQDTDLSQAQSTPQTLAEGLQTPQPPQAVQTVQAEDMPSGDYPYLEEFIALVNSVSDPPTFVYEDAAQWDAYFTEMYDAWQAGEIFQEIVTDENGVPVFDTRGDVLVGRWRESIAGRGVIDISSAGGAHFNIEIAWADSAFTTYYWYCYGIYDAAQGGIAYNSGCQVEETYDEQDVPPTTTVMYEDGSGLFLLTEEGIIWEDYKENAGEDCVFIKE